MRAIFSLLLALGTLLTCALSTPVAAEQPTEANLAPRAQVSARYVLTSFTQDSESNLYVYTSSDATTFTKLAGPTYTLPTGLIRDPSVMYHTESVPMLRSITTTYRFLFSGYYYICCEHVLEFDRVSTDPYQIPLTGMVLTSQSLWVFFVPLP